MLRIDLYTEITCPWCIVGQHRLDKVLAERFPELLVGIHHHPVLLLPDAPASGLYIPDLLRIRYGITDPKVAFARPEAEARASGLSLDLGRQRMAYPTQAAHALILAAREHGTQHRLAVAITNAYFLDAKNIGSADVLADIASGHGFEYAEARAIALDPAEYRRVEQEAANSAAAGVRSVPHFVFGGRIAINGGRSEDEIASSLQEATRFIASNRVEHG
ncbi:DsbA family oxidoreductase [Paraburkholderia phytofirmans]|uniref:DSBA oxidoreductase n=1 Tax=Paraburkholderia phytofirmans (strain DSM 17436 / LMG 22146 / PsJN) TaxID=398527 RepID=B2T955_PARPJ|nr:DsbA family protein [Paraburkholderia phytofirmans]ACD20957.1 DSBA oxidoreductase [Paraburkholderia phytofirmans PsJN]